MNNCNGSALDHGPVGREEERRSANGNGIGPVIAASALSAASGFCRPTGPDVAAGEGPVATSSQADQRPNERAAAVLGIRVRTEVLRIELAARGWTSLDLAHAAGISPATVSAAIHGRRISARSLRRMAEALQRQPVVPVAADLALA